MKRKILCLFLSLIQISLLIIEKPIHTANNPSHHNFIIYPEKKDDDMISDSVKTTMTDAQNYAVIFSSPIMQSTIPREVQKYEIEDQMDAQWSIYVNKDKDFLVFIPEPYSPEQLENWGFNKHKFDHYSIKTFDELGDFRKELSQTRNMHHLKELFNTEKNLPKRIILDGHGAESSEIVAGMDMQETKKLLWDLNSLNTEFLFINSCRVAGKNLLKIQEGLQDKINDDLQSLKILYPIVLSTTTDTIGGALHTFRINDFFSSLNQWLTSSPMILKKTKISRTTLQEVLKQLKYVDIRELASVRFPGTNAFFRAVDVDDMLILTYANVQKFVLESVLTYQKDPQYAKILQELRSIDEQAISASSSKQKTLDADRNEKLKKLQAIRLKTNAPAPTIHVSDSAKYIMVYPTNLMDIAIEKDTRPLFISKIVGPAQHYIKMIKNSYLKSSDYPNSCSQLAREFLFHRPGDITPYGFHDKAWFIETMKFSEQTIHSAVIHLDVSHKQKPIVRLYGIQFGEPIFAQGNLPNTAGLESKKISLEEYIEGVKNIYQKTIPSAAALKEATAGNEDLKTVENVFNKFIQNAQHNIKE